MASMNRSIEIDVRKVARESMTVSVQLKNMFWLKIGLQILKFGCWLTGAQFVDEFPMSLYQKDQSAK